jgi:hypothetical protein
VEGSAASGPNYQRNPLQRLRRSNSVEIVEGLSSFICDQLLAVTQCSRPDIGALVEFGRVLPLIKNSAIVYTPRTVAPVEAKSSCQIQVPVDDAPLTAVKRSSENNKNGENSKNFFKRQLDRKEAAPKAVKANVESQSNLPVFSDSEEEIRRGSEKAAAKPEKHQRAPVVVQRAPVAIQNAAAAANQESPEAAGAKNGVKKRKKVTTQVEKKFMKNGYIRKIALTIDTEMITEVHSETESEAEKLIEQKVEQSQQNLNQKKKQGTLLNFFGKE